MLTCCLLPQGDSVTLVSAVLEGLGYMLSIAQVCPASFSSNTDGSQVCAASGGLPAVGFAQVCAGGLQEGLIPLHVHHTFCV